MTKFIGDDENLVRQKINTTGVVELQGCVQPRISKGEILLFNSLRAFFSRFFFQKY